MNTIRPRSVARAVAMLIVGLAAAPAALAQSGACCRPSGGCTVTASQAACAWGFVGTGTTCTPGQCTSTIVRQAIVGGGGSTAGGTLTLSGVITSPVGGGQFDGSALASADGTHTLVGGLLVGGLCPTGDCASGACCAPGGACTIITGSAACFLGSLYQGGGTVCSPNPCSGGGLPPTGACCLGSACILSFKTKCPTGGYRGDGSTCATTPCSGACCTPGACTLTPLGGTCSGTYLGDYTVCSPNTCPASGACCTGGSCALAFASVCTGASYRGDNSVCNPTPCTGACCDSYGACAVVVIGTCAGVYKGDYSACAGQNCPAEADYLNFTYALLAREIVRWEYSLNPNPRMYAVLAALRRVATVNPNAKLAQLTQFATAYDQMLAAAYPNDPKLFFGLNLMTAVRFPAAPVSITGLNLEVGADVLTDLGLDPVGPPYGDRTWQATWFQAAQDRSLADAPRIGEVLLTSFRGVDASGGFNPALRAAAIAFVRTQPRHAPPMGCSAPSACWYIDPAPTPAGLHASYPAVEAAFGLLPANAAQYAADAAGGFAALNVLITGELNAVQSFIQAKRTETAGALAGQYSTLAASVQAAGTQAVVNAALAARTTDLTQVATSRARLGMFIETIRNETPVMQSTAIVQRGYLSAAHTQAADWAANTKAVVFGVSAIAGGVATIYQTKGISAVSSSGDIYGGLQQVLGVFGVDVDVPILGPLLAPTSPRPMVDNTLKVLTLQLQNQMESMRAAMDARFDKVDDKLSDIYSTMLTQFNAQNLQNQYTLTQLQGIQQTLSNQTSNLARFEQDLFGVLDNFLNHFLLTDLNIALDYLRRTGGDLPYAGGGSYAEYEGNLFTWATIDALDANRAGTTAPLPYDITALTPLMFTNALQPIGFRINGLRTMPTALGRPSLGSTNVANPTTWAVNADTYGYFARQNPWYTTRLLRNAPARLNSVITKGTDVQSVMTNARSGALFTALINDYNSKSDVLNTQINAVEAAVLQPYPGVDIYGPVDQFIAQSTLDHPRNYPASLMTEYNSTCTGTIPVFNGFSYSCPGTSTSGDPAPVQTPHAPANPTRVQGTGSLSAWGWDASHVFLPPEYKVAAALNLGGRDLKEYIFCWRLAGTAGHAAGASQQWPSFTFGGDIASGSFDVELWWNPGHQGEFHANPTNNGPELDFFYIPGDGRGMTLVATRRFSFTMHTQNTCGYDFSPRGAFQGRWDFVDTSTCDGCCGCCTPTMFNHFFDAQSPDSTTIPSTPPTMARVWTATTIVNQASLDQVRADIRARFKSLQYDIYNGVADALEDNSSNGNVKNAADLATVPIKAIDAYASLGIPESHRRSDLLRGILRGNELGLDRRAMRDYYRALASGINAGANPLTARPAPFWDNNASNPSPARSRTNYLQNELNAILAANRPEQPPMMQWALANLNHLLNNLGKTARDDRYLMQRITTPLVVPAPGVLANDTPAPRPSGQAAILRAELFSLPTAGMVILNPDGGFTYTPPSPLPANLTTVSFQYKAKASLTPPSTLPADQELSDVVTVVIDIADDCVPMIVSQPNSAPFNVNGTASFLVTAAAQQRIAYRWHRNGVPLVDTQFGACCAPDLTCSVVSQSDCSHIGGNWFGAGTVCGGPQLCYSCPLPICPPAATDTMITGAATPLLTLTNLHTADRANYTCVVTSACGSVTTVNAALGACSADFNGSGAATVADIFAFLTAWFAGSPSADFNGSGGAPTVADIFAFLTAWFAGCQ